MEYAKLNNGVKMPMIGYGTYRTPASKTEKCVELALNVGYRSIDTAQCYYNEREVGNACRKSGISRAELFVTTKLWACSGYEDTLSSIEESLHRLDIGYIDLLLMHEPTGNVNEIYRAMERAYKDGKVRAIGVSNFLEDRYIDLINNCKVIPAVNQVETHVYRQQKDLRTLEKREGTYPESWSPLAAGENGIDHDPILIKIAERYHRSVSQIALRFLTQQDIIIIPKSMSEKHMAENLGIFDFKLNEEDMREIENLDRGRSLFGWW